MTLQLLDGPHSIPHLQTSRKIHCHNHGPSSSPTEKYQEKKSIQPLPKKTLDVSPSHEPSNTCSNTMNNSMESTFDIRKKYFDQTEKLPLQSSTGHNYVFILYKYDKNEIVSVPLKH